MNFFVDRREQVLTATWTPRHGVDVSFSDLPDVWLIALDRLAHDLHVRQFGASIEHIDLMAMYDADGGAVWLGSSVTVAGQGPRGGNGSGMGASVDADVEAVLVSMADLVQTEVAEVRTAWPWGEAGGFFESPTHRRHRDVGRQGRPVGAHRELAVKN